MPKSPRSYRLTINRKKDYTSAYLFSSKNLIKSPTRTLLQQLDAQTFICRHPHAFGMYDWIKRHFEWVPSNSNRISDSQKFTPVTKKWDVSTKNESSNTKGKNMCLVM